MIGAEIASKMPAGEAVGKAFDALVPSKKE